MRYMMLIYSKEMPEGPSPEERAQIVARHVTIMREAKEKGVYEGAEPLTPSPTATFRGGRTLPRRATFRPTRPDPLPASARPFRHGAIH